MTFIIFTWYVTVHLKAKHRQVRQNYYMINAGNRNDT